MLALQISPKQSLQRFQMPREERLQYKQLSRFQKDSLLSLLELRQHSCQSGARQRWIQPSNIFKLAILVRCECTRKQHMQQENHKHSSLLFATALLMNMPSNDQEFAFFTLHRCSGLTKSSTSPACMKSHSPTPELVVIGKVWAAASWLMGLMAIHREDVCCRNCCFGSRVWANGSTLSQGDLQHVCIPRQEHSWSAASDTGCIQDS